MTKPPTALRPRRGTRDVDRRQRRRRGGRLRAAHHLLEDRLQRLIGVDGFHGAAMGHDLAHLDVGEVEDAAETFYRGLQSDRLEIAFPWRFAALLKLLRILPAPLAMAVTRRMVPDSQGR